MQKLTDYNFDIANIVLSIYVTKENTEAVHRNRPCYGLAYLLDGPFEYTFTHGQKLVANKNDVVFLPKNTSYEVASANSGTCYAINFEINANESFMPCVVKLKNFSKVEECFRKAVNVWKSKSIGYEMKCKSELYNILYIIQQENLMSYLSKNKIDMIKPAIDYIHENYLSSHLSVSALSQMCNMSAEYFRKIFKSFFGASPVAYINNLKIQNAKELLSSKLYSVTDAALLSGFSDMSHFSREFKKHTDFSPREYLKRQM